MSKKAQIPAGDYIFGEDIPAGKYNLKAIRGTGNLWFFKNGNKQPDVSFMFGTNDDGGTFYNEEYWNLRAEDGDRLKIEGSTITEITEAGKIEFTND